jgi:hypothetical protein
MGHYVNAVILVWVYWYCCVPRCSGYGVMVLYFHARQFFGFCQSSWIFLDVPVCKIDEIFHECLYCSMKSDGTSLGRPTTWNTTSCFPTNAQIRFEISNYSWSNEKNFINSFKWKMLYDDCNSVIMSSRSQSRKCPWTSLIAPAHTNWYRCWCASKVTTFS